MHMSLIRTNKIFSSSLIAAEIKAEIVRVAAEGEILSKITKAFSTGLANLLVPIICY